MNIALEIFGYIGSALVVISMMMTSVNKIRKINICGAIICTIYSSFHGAGAVVVMNLCLIMINGFHLIKQYIAKKRQL